MIILPILLLFLSLPCFGAWNQWHTAQPTSMPTSMPTWRSFSANVTHFQFDLSSGNLTLFFNDVMNFSTLDVSRIQLVNKPRVVNVTNFVSLSLTGLYQYSRNVRKTSNGTIISILLTADDYARVVSNDPPIFADKDSAYLTIDRDAIISLRNESVVAINDTNPLSAQSFNPDTLPPFLSYYQLNMQLGFLSLFFSEPIDISTFTIEGLALQGSRNVRLAPPGLDQYVELMDDSHWNITLVSEYNRRIDVFLGAPNLNAIKRSLGLATTKDRTWLSAYRSFVNDSHGNPISMKAFDAYNGVGPHRYLADTLAPTIDYWDINMNNAQPVISIFFTETIYRSYFNFAGVTLTNQSSAHGAFNLTINAPVNTTENNHHYIRFQLNPQQVLELQGFDNFCSSRSNCFLILAEGLVIDTAASQNPYQGYGIATYDNALQVRDFKADRVKPKLIAFALDVHVETQRLELTLTFSKRISIASFRPQYLTLQSESNLVVGTEYISILQHYPRYRSSIIVNTTTDDATVLVTLLAPFPQMLQASAYLGKATYYTYIAATYKLVTDRVTNPSPNNLVDIQQSEALEASRVTTDRTPPWLFFWSLDLAQGLVLLNFSRPIDTTTLQFASAVLSSDSIYLPLSTVLLPLTDATVFNAFQASTYSQVKKTRTSSLRLQLSTANLRYLQTQRSLCTTTTNCYLSFADNFVGALEDYDSVGTAQYVPVQSVDFVPVQDLVFPESGPRLQNVTVDMNSREMTFYFNRAIIASDLNISAIELFANTTGISAYHTRFYELADGDQKNVTSGISYVLTSASYTNDDIAQNVTIHLSRQDFIAIQRRFPLLTNSSVYALARIMSSSAATDVYGTSLTLSGNAEDYVAAMYFVFDTLGPKLLGAYFDPVTFTNVTLYFDEAILVDRIRTSGMSLFKSTSGAFYSLANADVVYPVEGVSSSAVIVLDLTPLRSTLTTASVATRQSNSILYVRQTGAVQDASYPHYNNNTGSDSSAVRDGLSFVSFRLDLASRALLLEMTMPVRGGIASVVATDISVVSSLGTVYKFTSSFDSIAYPDYKDIITTAAEEAQYASTTPHLLRLSFSTTQLKGILSAINVSQPASTLSLSLESTAMTDAHGKTFAASSSNGIMSLPCVALIPDRTPPAIESVDLNLNTGFLTLAWSRPVALATIDFLSDKTLVLLDAQSPSNQVSLSLDSSVSISYGSSSNDNRTTTVVLNLNHRDSYTHTTMRERILFHAPPFVFSANHLYLSAPQGWAYDETQFPALPSAAITEDSALAIASITRDTTAPTLLGYTLHLQRRLLLLNFSEAVNTSTIQVTSFTLAAATTTPSENYVLTSTSHVVDMRQTLNSFFVDTAGSNGNSSLSSNTTSSRGDAAFYAEATDYVAIALSTNDIDNIMRKAPRLLLSASETYLSYLAGSFADLADNVNDVVFYRYGRAVDDYVPDFTPPRLLEFNISLQSGEMTLLFDEVVDCQSFRLDRFFFQSRIFVGELRNGARGRDPSIILADKITDKYRDKEDDLAQYVDNADDLWQFYLSNASYCASSVRYETRHTVVISPAELLRIKATNNILKNASSSYLRVLDGAFGDVFGNKNEAIVDAAALQVTQYEPDSIPPELVAYSLSTTHLLTLFFDEPINVDMLHLRSLAFQDDVRNATVQIPVEYATITRYNVLKTVIELEFSNDFNFIYGDTYIFHVLPPNLHGGGGQFITYLTAPATTVEDIAGNALVAITQNEALQIGPSIVYWDLDLNAGTLSLTFSTTDMNMTDLLYSASQITLQNGRHYGNISYTLAYVSDNVTEIVASDYPDLQNTKNLAFSSQNTQDLVQSTLYAPQEDTPSRLWTQQFRITLDARDVAFLKSSGLVKPSWPTYELYLSASFGLAHSIDTSDLLPQLSSVVIPAKAARQIRYLTKDTTPPACLSFDLDFASNALILQFSEPVQPSSLLFSDFTLFSASTGHVVTFAATTMSQVVVSLQSSDPTRLELSFAPLSAWDEVKLLYYRSNHTLDRLALSAGVVTDFYGNAYDVSTEDRITDNPNVDPNNNLPVENTDIITLNNVIEDTTPPGLDSYSVNLNTYHLGLGFDDLIDPAYYAPVSASPVRLYLLPNISSALPYLISLFNDSKGVARFANLDQLLSAAEIVLLSNDTLVERAQDLQNERSLTLDLDFLGYDAERLEGIYYSSSTSANNVASADISFYTNKSTAYIAIQYAQDLLGNRDVAFNATTQQPNFLVSRATSFVSRTSTAQVLAFDYTESGGTITITVYFDVAMDIASFVCSDFVLQDVSTASPSSSHIASWTTSDCTVTTPTSGVSRSVTFTLAKSTATGSTDVGQSADTTYLNTVDAVSGSSITSVDVYGNSITSLNSVGIPLQVGPQLRRASLDMDSGELLLVMTKKVTLSSWSNASAIGLSYINTAGSNRRRIVWMQDDVVDEVTGTTVLSTLSTYGTSAYSSNTATESSMLSLFLGQQNLNLLKQIAPRGVDFSTQKYVSVSLSAGAFADSDDSSVLSVATTRLLDRFYPDTQNPQVVNVTLDLGLERLIIQFDEPLQWHSVLVTHFFLQTHANNPDGALATDVLHLANTSRSISTQENSLTLQLTRHDANLLKASPDNLAANKSFTYLGVLPGAAYDTAGNYLVPIPYTDALQITKFLPDTVAPILTSFDINLNVNPVLLTLTFNEAVDIETFNVTAITLQSRFLASSGRLYRLTGGHVRTSSSSNEITDDDGENSISVAERAISDVLIVELTTFDVNNMKRSGALLRNAASSFLVQRALVSDLAGNIVTSTLDGFALSCRTYTADSTAPEIVYSRVDMQDGTLSLSFNEPVILSSVVVSGLTLVSTRPTVHYDNIQQAPYFFYRLTTSTTASITPSTAGISTSAGLSENITLTFSANDLDQIKRRYPLLSSTVTSFLAPDSKFVGDYVLNGITQRNYQHALPVSSYEIDRVAPKVIAYSLNMQAQPLYVQLTLSECIDIRTVRPDQLYLQNFATRRFGQFVTLQDAFVWLGPFDSQKMLRTISATASSTITGDASVDNTRVSTSLGALLAMPASLETQYASTNANLATSTDDCRILTFLLPDEVVKYMKAQGIGYDESSGFLTFTTAFLRDHADNTIQPQYDGAVVNTIASAPQTTKVRPYPPLAPTTLILDTQKPVVTRWFYDPLTQTLTLDFTEPILFVRGNNTNSEAQDSTESSIYTIDNNGESVSVPGGDHFRTDSGDIVYLSDLYFTHDTFFDNTFTISVTSTSSASTGNNREVSISTASPDGSFTTSFSTRTTEAIANRLEQRTSPSSTKHPILFALPLLVFVDDPQDATSSGTNHTNTNTSTGIDMSQSGLQWVYSQDRTRAQVTLTAAQHAYCLTYTTLSRLLLTAITQSHFYGPQRNLIFLNVTALSQADRMSMMSNDEFVRGHCPRNLFSGAYEGVDFLAYLANSSSPSSRNADENNNRSSLLGLVLGSGYLVQDVSAAGNWLAGTIGRSPRNAKGQYLSPVDVALDARNDNYQLDAKDPGLGYLLPGAPDCSRCPSSTYTFSNCSSVADRVCRTCSTCQARTQYAMVPCTSHGDTVCADCSVCRYGTYQAEACTATSNTVCAPCSTCPALSYASRSCARGLDTLCTSCLTCDVYPDASAREYCTQTGPNAHRVRLWRAAFCCVSRLGVSGLCTEYDKTDLDAMVAKKQGTLTTAQQLRYRALQQYRQLEKDSIRYDYDELSSISAN